MILHVSSASKDFKIVDGISEVDFSDVDANKLDEAQPGVEHVVAFVHFTLGHAIIGDVDSAAVESRLMHPNPCLI